MLIKFILTHKNTILKFTMSDFEKIVEKKWIMLIKNLIITWVGSTFRWIKVKRLDIMKYYSDATMPKNKKLNIM